MGQLLNDFEGRRTFWSSPSDHHYYWLTVDCGLMAEANRLPSDFCFHPGVSQPHPVAVHSRLYEPVRQPGPHPRSFHSPLFVLLALDFGTPCRIFLDFATFRILDSPVKLMLTNERVFIFR
jgi:hypothetical protein